MPEDISRKRRAFLGRPTGRPLPAPEIVNEDQPIPQRQVTRHYAPAPPQEQAAPSPQRRPVREQMAPARRRLTADSGFGEVVSTPYGIKPKNPMSDQEIEDFVSAAEMMEPGSHIRPGGDTGSMAVGGPGFKEPKPGV